MGRGVAHDLEVLVAAIGDNLEFGAVVDALFLGDEVTIELAGNRVATEAGTDLLGAVINGRVSVNIEFGAVRQHNRYLFLWF